MRNIEFINAGAGSGKTYSLTQKLTQLIINQACRADEIILTTFTENAAAELKGKAREALLEAGRIVEAGLLASASIGTVHSVALSFVQKFWHLTGSGTRLQVMPEEDQSFYLNQAIATIPGPDEVRRLHELTRQLNFVDDRSFPDFNKWKADLKRVVELALNNRIVNFQDSQTQSLAEIDILFGPEGDGDFITPEFKQPMTHLRDKILSEKASASKSKRLRKIRGFLNLPNNPAFHHYWNLLGYLSGGNNITGAHRQMPPVAGLIETLSRIYSSNQMRNWTKEYTSLIFNLAERSLHVYDAYKLEHNLIDYNDMEVRFLNLLDHPEARQEIAGRYRILFVDEFQDSNPIQIEIFAKLSDIIQQSYWVGDPKQSIFGFRGTDSALVKAILSEFGQNDGRNLTIGQPLSQSWRSRPELVNLANNIFEPAFEGHLQYIPLQPIRNLGELPDTDNHSAIQEWSFTGQNSNLDHFAHHTASEINKLLSQERQEGIVVVDKSKSRLRENRDNQIVTRPLEPGDIAILGRAREHLYKLAKAMNKFGIQVAGEQKNLIKTAEVSLLVALLNYHLDNNDTLAKATIRFLTDNDLTPSGIIDERLEFLANPEPDEDQVENGDNPDNWCNNLDILIRLAGFRESSRHLSVSNLIDKLMALTALPDYVSRWQNPLQRKNNLQAVRNLSVQYENRCLGMGFAPSIRGFIEFLNSDESEELKQGTAKGKNAVNVMTYHKAKGLEWPVVILTDLEFDPLSSDRLIRKEFFGISLDSAREIDLANPFEGKVIINLPWFMGSRSLPDISGNRLAEMERFPRCRARVLDEARRLMYVGITRARDIQISSIHKPDNLLSITHLYPDGYNPAGQQNIFMTNDFARQWTFDYPDSEFPTLDRQQFEVLEKPGAIMQNRPLVVSPSKAGDAGSAAVKLIHDFGKRITRLGGKDEDTAVGNCIHNIFYSFGRQEPEQYLHTIREMVRQYSMNGILTDAESIASAAQNLYEYLAGSYGAPVAIHKELPLQLVSDGPVYSGNIDLVWETLDSLILVDYKTYSGAIGHVLNPAHEKYSGRYATQLALYKRMLENCHPDRKKVKSTLLYYAVLGVIVNVSQG